MALGQLGRLQLFPALPAETKNNAVPRTTTAAMATNGVRLAVWSDARQRLPAPMAPRHHGGDANQIGVATGRSRKNPTTPRKPDRGSFPGANGRCKNRVRSRNCTITAGARHDQ
jgi:hypothetical protein